MSEYEDFDDETDQESEGIAGLRKAKKAAEARAKEAEEAAAAGAAAQRELAALKAGLDPGDKLQGYFLNTYQGDPTPEAMKAAAIEAGVLPEIDPVAAQSANGQAQMASAVRGGETVPLGTTVVGSGAVKVEVPAEQAPMWQAFEAAAKTGNFQGAAEILRSHGHQMDGIADVEALPGSGVANTSPI